MLYFTAKNLRIDFYLASVVLYLCEIYLWRLLLLRSSLTYRNIFDISGEQARSLFIRSKLPLPELSKIWFVRHFTVRC